MKIGNNVFVAFVVLVSLGISEVWSQLNLFEQECPHNQVMQNGSCIDEPECHSGMIYKRGWGCVPQCRPNHVWQNGKCVPKPPCLPTINLKSTRCVPKYEYYY